MIRFSSLGSGSKGNATLVEAGETRLLIDCGFSAREIEKRLALLACEADQLTGILLTHEHGDHARGVWVLAKRYNLPVYMSGGTAKALTASKTVALHIITQGLAFQVGAITVLPVAVPHDAREPLQFVFTYKGLKLGILTDIGHITPHVLRCYSACDGLLVEANHDAVMLAAGPYPHSLKQRVGGAWGHLNNAQTAALLAGLELSSLQILVVGHISQKNNAMALLKRVIEPVTERIPKVVYASQDEGTGWLALNEG